MFFSGSSSAAAYSNNCNVIGVNPLCANKVPSLLDVAKKVATAPFHYAAQSTANALSSWVADAAKWLLSRVVSFINTSTSPDLGATWFSDRYRFMVGIAVLAVLPMLLLASVRAIARQDASQLTRSFFVYLPVAALGMFMAVTIANALLAITDALSASVAHDLGGNLSNIFTSSSTALSGSGGGMPSFVIFIVGIFMVIGAFVVWLELLVRSAAVTVSVFFFPLILAGLVWPATSVWTKRIIETLVSLILSKFIIVAVISLAAAALANPGGGGFGAVMGGATLMLMAAFSPFALLKLIPIAEGGAIGHLEGLSRRPVHMAQPQSFARQAVGMMRSSIGSSTRDNLAVAGALPSGGTGVGTGIAGKATAKPSSTPREALNRVADPRGASSGSTTGGPPHNTTSEQASRPEPRPPTTGNGGTHIKGERDG